MADGMNIHELNEIINEMNPIGCIHPDLTANGLGRWVAQ